MTIPAAAAPRKHRQTRIPEHLQAVKKGSSSPSASSSSSAASSSSALKSSLVKALRTANAPKKSERPPATIAASHQSNAAAASSMMDTGTHTHSPRSSLSHPLQEQQYQQQQALVPSNMPVATPSFRTSTTSPHSASTTPTKQSSNTQASLQAINGAPCSTATARLPYAPAHDRPNDMSASMNASTPNSSLYSVPSQQQRQTAVSRPSTSQSTMAQDSTLLARSCSSASSMAYSQPDFTFSVAPSPQSLSLSSSACTQPSFDALSSSFSSAYGHAQMPVWSSPPNHSNPQVNVVQSPSTMHTSSSDASLFSLQSQQQPSASLAAFNKPTTTRVKRSLTSMSNMSGASSTSSAAAAASATSLPLSSSLSTSAAPRSGLSPRSPGASFPASLILSVSTDGKARLTSPQSPKKPAFTKSNPPKALVAAAMLRSSTTNNAVKTPLRPSMMRSNTTDPRLSSSRGYSSVQKREVSEVNGVGRVVGLGKMFDLQEDQKNSMSMSVNSNVAALPQSLNLDIEMDLAAGMGLPGYPSSYTQVSYPYAAHTPAGAIFTPPQSGDMGKQVLPSASSQSGRAFYPEKERFQSSWKFPSGIGGLNLHASGHPIAPGSTPASTASSSPTSGIISAFPSMHSLNASIVNVMQTGNMGVNGLASSPVVASPVDAASQDMSRRQSRIQAWLDSPDLQDGEDNHTPGYTWSSLPFRNDDTDSSSAPPPTASSSSGFSISPANIMTRTASKLQMSSVSMDQEFEEIEVMRASGKSIRPLKVSKKRRMLGDYDVDEEVMQGGGLSNQDRDAMKAGLGLPFQAAASSRQVTPTPDGASPGKRNRLDKNGDRMEQLEGAKARRSKKKGSSICSCGTGDDGEAMIQCEECACWFHLACVGVDEEGIPERWFCTPCASASAALQGASSMAPYTSSAHPAMQNQLDPFPANQQTPKRPGLTREPTFSKNTTPTMEAVRRFDDAPLVEAQVTSRLVAIPSTPQGGTVNFTPGHSHTASLSRAYAPVTPRVGFTTGQTSAPGTQYQWDTYSPHTPSNAIAHSRRLSRQHQHINTPLSSWSHSAQWDELPSSVPRRGADDAERTKHWEQFYNAPPPAAINPIPMTPPLASHSAFAASESFLQPFEQETSVSQRFLAIHSTPSQWADTAQFASNMW